MPRCVITRRLHFSAAHRLWNPKFSPAENEATFGMCNNPNYHGHNYDLDISVEGEIDPDTGYVLDIQHIKDVAWQCLVSHLNVDVPWFASLNPTAENIAVVCWQVLEPALKPARLKQIRLWETERNYVDYYGA